MPISRVAQVGANSAAAATATSSSISPAGLNLYAVAGFGGADGDTAAAHSSVALGSSLSQVGAAVQAFFDILRTTMWAASVSAGSASLVLTAAAAQDVGISGAVAVYSGVDSVRGSQEAGDQGFSGTSTSPSPSRTVTTVAGDMVVMVIGIYLGSSQAVTIDNLDGDAVVINTPGSAAGLHHIVIEKVAVGTSTTIGCRINWSSDTSWGYGSHAIALVPTAGGGSSQGRAARLLLA